MNTIIKKLTGVAPAGVETELVSDAWPSDSIICWTHVVCRIVTSGAGEPLLFFKRGDEYYVLGAQEYTIAGDVALFSGMIYLPGDYRPGCRFYNVSSTTDVEFVGYGFVVE